MHVPTSADSDRMRLYASRWREVGSTQERLIREEATADPAVCLARGLALIALARRLRVTIESGSGRELRVAEARRTWQALRAHWAR